MIWIRLGRILFFLGGLGFSACAGGFGGFAFLGWGLGVGIGFECVVESRKRFCEREWSFCGFCGRFVVLFALGMNFGDNGVL